MFAWPTPPSISAVKSVLRSPVRSTSTCPAPMFRSRRVSGTSRKCKFPCPAPMSILSSSGMSLLKCRLQSFSEWPMCTDRESCETVSCPTPSATLYSTRGSSYESLKLKSASSRFAEPPLMVSCPAPISNFARADLARCGSTIFVVCFVPKTPPRPREYPRPCQIGMPITSTNATAPNVAPSEMPGGALGLRLLWTLSQILPIPMKIRMSGQYVRRIDQGSNAGFHLRSRNSTPNPINTMGNTKDVLLGLPSWAMAHLRYLLLRARFKKSSGTRPNYQKHSAIAFVLHAAIEAGQGHVVAALPYAIVLKFAIARSARVVGEGFRENFLDRAR